VIRSLRILLAGAVVVHGTHALAALTEWRTEVQVTNGSGNSTQFAFDGGLNVPSSYQSLTTGSVSAFAEASSSLSATGFVPTLRARAVSSPTRAQAVAWGVQGYTNGLATPLSTTLLLNLTANVTGANDLEARIYLFEDENFEFSRDPGTILSESNSQLWPGFEDFANNAGPTGFDVLFGNISGPVNETRSFDFTVDPGDSFYVWGRLVATADNPGEVDAFSTLTASFTNTEGLQPAAVVPVPATMWLLVSGLLTLLAYRSVTRKTARHTG
jgi:hypothetical protein